MNSCVSHVEWASFTNCPFPSPPIYSNLGLVFRDIWGPAPLSSSCGAKYYVHFIDAFLRYTWIYFLQSKSQLHSAFFNFQCMAELQLGSKIKCLQTDNAMEYVSLSKHLQASGIIYRFSCSHIH